MAAAAACRCDAPRALRWAHSALGDCIATRADAASLAFGLASLATALAAQAPQVATNCRLNSAAALSPWFLVRRGGGRRDRRACRAANENNENFWTPPLLRCADAA
jgi:hypothetical protein